MDVACRPVGELDEHVERWSDNWPSTRQLTNHYRTLKAAITRYYSGGPRSKPIPNFEKILGDMIAFSHWVTPAPYGDTLRQAACGGTMPPNFTFKSAELSDAPAPYAGTVEIMDQRTYLLIELARFFRSLCVKIQVSSESHRKYQALAQGLTGAFDVGVYNLNYDTLELLAWPNAFTGFNDKGEFDAAALHQRREWAFVYHLHGSVHQSLDRPFGGERIIWRSDLDNSASFIDGPEGHPADVRSEGENYPENDLGCWWFQAGSTLGRAVSLFARGTRPTCL